MLFVTQVEHVSVKQIYYVDTFAFIIFISRPAIRDIKFDWKILTGTFPEIMK